MRAMSVPSGGEQLSNALSDGRPGPPRAGRTRRASQLDERAAAPPEAGGRGARGGPDDDALAELHRDHYTSLVRLASLVVGDVGVAEQVTQDAFVKLQLRWGGLRRVDRAPAYLRSAVLNAARSHLRRRKVSDRYEARRTVASAAPTPESAALGAAQQDRVVAALRRLPPRQREAVALRYYLDLGEADIASTMGVSTGSVKTHLHRGLASLAEHLGEEDA